jgi:hypothetical protein
MTIDDIRHAERDINALHDRIYEALPFRDKSDADRAKWRDACTAFRAYRHPALELWRPDVLEKVRSGAEVWRSDAILFLEADPWFFRSGYLKQKVLRALKGAALEPEEAARLKGVFLLVVDSRERREFREYCRLAAKVPIAGLRDELTKRLESSDEGVRRRATEMLRYLGEQRAA